MRAASNLGFVVASMKVTCTVKGFTQTSPAEAPTPGAGVAALRKLVSGIPLLKDPFRTNLLADLSDASTAISGKKPDNASAKLGDFSTQIQAAPLRAHLSSAQRSSLLDLATSIRSALASRH